MHFSFKIKNTNFSLDNFTIYIEETIDWEEEEEDVRIYLRWKPWRLKKNVEAKMKKYENFLI